MTDKWPPELIPIMEASVSLSTRDHGDGGDDYLMGIHFALTIAEKAPELALFLRKSMNDMQPGLERISETLYAEYLKLIEHERRRHDADT